MFPFFELILAFKIIAMNIPLLVYSASAGSGKTFTLATEYIKLVVSNPLAYRQILAVTFTNKATEEMKMRILSQLYGIWKGLKSSKGYTDKVCKELNASPEYVSRQAGTALSLLLHNYSYFRINTIDTFFQSVLRNLARELDLTANLRIGLNDVQVEELAVDELIENLSATDRMLHWILSYIKETIGDDRSWNIIGQIKLFGRTLFKDYYKQHSRQLYEVMAQPRFFENYTKELRDMRTHSKERMKELASTGIDELGKVGLAPSDLAYGESGIGGFFLKAAKDELPNAAAGKRINDCADRPEAWYTKSSPNREVIHQLAEQSLMSILKEMLHEWCLYRSADLTLRHLNQLRLLDGIERQVRTLNETANRFLLSDTQQLLHDLIDNSDSPFIFEKIGTQLEHIMIDEFQDTSTVQWQNFKVLLQETMSHSNTENLIVGDVKQSIYRWRSGDWRLLANIADEFPHATKEQLKLDSLDTNYRSARRVVEFNNKFFTEAANMEGVAAYKDVVQKVPEQKPMSGYVSIALLPNDDYQTRVLNQLVQQVSQLIDLGIPTAAIAILVRSNHLIPLIANYFMEHKPEVSIVSDEAFRLDASPAIQIIIQALRLLIHPDDFISKAYLARMYARQPLHEGALDDMLPAEFAEHRDELLRLPLYELTERLCSIFQLQHLKGQSAYLFAFFDQVSTYVNEQSTDIPAFLAEWDETLCGLTIQSPEVNGIRLISIHKSKGLEFPYVFIPFCDWSMEHSNILWCQPDVAPFNQLPIVPIDYTQKGLVGTIYEADYEEEHQQNMVDNLNLLYVAFTRASKGLMVIGKRGTKTGRSAVIEKCLPRVASLLQGAMLSGKDDKQATLLLEYGTLEDSTADTDKKADSDNDDKSKNVFLQESVPLHIGLETFSQKTEFRQSNDSRNFAALPDDDEQQRTEYIRLGSVLHNVFASIRTVDDVERALQRMELDGILYDRNITRERLESMIRKRFEDERVAEWYSSRWTLFNECAILDVDPKTNVAYERRPDRVMTDGRETVVVDFKFGRPRNEYHDQVRIYMNLLSKMGHENVRGYLWYVFSNEIVEVNI